ncbi:histidinol-phosphate transaminase [Tissierella praeacuta]|uniref:histidinol-phosphate transaminase n=1 Tax=Tissierella praeacuta TaxID=43131 RepID=UPI001C12701F|nr:histidinol-phosphate transaminase [Tissierella praeacuta]MBU5257327.1 histidinol-phosphate transaminase [Tissierella praeacuta]
MEMIKNNIKNLKEYKINKKPYRIKLDANEGKDIFLKDISKKIIRGLEKIDINLYPDTDSFLLRVEIGKYLNINPDNIVTGNGSSEMIELIMKTFIDKDDIVLSFVPTFSMYSIFTQIYSGRFIGINSNEDFSIDIDILIEKTKEINPKVIFICNPNNPTGSLVKKHEVERLLNNVDCIVVVDEAYMEFAEGSMVEDIYKYKNLIVLRTLSKALGLAAIRLGYMISNVDIVNVINRVRAPYNLNAISQYMGIEALKNKERIFQYVEEVKRERKYLYEKLTQLSLELWESNTNFIFFKSNIDELDKKLEEDGILIRAFSKELRGCYRVTVGNRWENHEFVKSLKEILENEKS